MPPPPYERFLLNRLTNTSAVVAIRRIGRRCVVVQRAAGTVEVLGFRQAMQEAVHEGRVFDLCCETELGLIVAHFAPAVALPIRVLPLPVTSVVLTHHLGFAVSSRGWHCPLGHRFVYHRNRDSEVGFGVVTVRHIAATVLLHHFDVARNANELRPGGRVGWAEWACGLISGRSCVEASCVDVVTESVVTDNAVDTQLEAGEASVEVGVSIPVTVVALGLEVESTSDTGIRDHDVKELHSSSFGDVETESIVLVLEVDKSVIEKVEREVSDLGEVGNSQLHAKLTEVVTAVAVFAVVERWNEPSLIVNETAVGSLFGCDSEPLVSGSTNVVGAKELFVDVLGDASVALLELKNLFSGEKAIQHRLDANPVGVHLFAEKLESVALCAWALNDFAQGGARISLAVTINDLAERGARIMETTAKAESFLFGGVIEGPWLLLETGEIRRVSDEFLYIEVVEILAALTEKAVQLFARIELN